MSYFEARVGSAFALNLGMLALAAVLGCGGQTAAGSDAATTGGPSGSETSTGTLDTDTATGSSAVTVSPNTGVVTGTSTSGTVGCSCDTGGIIELCTGTTTETATPWTSAATALLTGCQVRSEAEAGLVPTYTCVAGYCGPPCGASCICSSGDGGPPPSSGTATGTDTE